MSDVLGVLTAMDDEALTVRREDDTSVHIPRADVVTGKPVPARASTRLRISPDALERVCSAGWLPPDTQQLGDWVLRAAEGFTRRANSTLLVGDPGIPAPESLDRVRAFYADRGLPPLLQVVVGDPWQQTAVELGWTPARSPDVVVQVASVSQAVRAARAGRSTPPRNFTVDIADAPTAAWQRVYGRAGEVEPEVVRAVLTSGDQVGFAAVGDPPYAIGRAVVTRDWGGLTAVEVAPERRRSGLASAVVEALLDWAAAHGALSAYLQTRPDNAGAIALYERYGFITHHRYRYLTWPAAEAGR